MRGSAAFKLESRNPKLEIHPPEAGKNTKFNMTASRKAVAVVTPAAVGEDKEKPAPPAVAVPLDNLVPVDQTLTATLPIGL